MEDIGQIVVRVEFRRLEIQYRGNQDDASDIHAIALLEIAGKARGSGRAVALASEKFRRGPALVTSCIEPDEIRNGLDIFFNTVGLLGRLAGNGTAVSRGNRIDENEIADVEERHIVVHQLVRRWKERARVAHLHAPRTQ